MWRRIVLAQTYFFIFLPSSRIVKTVLPTNPSLGWLHIIQLVFKQDFKGQSAHEVEKAKLQL